MLSTSDHEVHGLNSAGGRTLLMTFYFDAWNLSLSHFQHLDMTWNNVERDNDPLYATLQKLLKWFRRLNKMATRAENRKIF